MNGAGATGDIKPEPEPVFELVPLEKNRGPDVTPDSTDYKLLTKNEQEICKGLKIQPKAYVMMKDAVIREACRTSGALKKKAIREICRIDTTKAMRLFDFFVWSGWIGKG